MKHTTLPQWLDDFIYNEQNAVYEPRPDEVILNADQSYDFIRLYLGTYFPRSYSEAYCIVNSMLDNKEYYNTLSNKEELYLLDICCGTGGEIIGAVDALCTRLQNLRRIYIESYDANVDAVRFLFHITDRLNENVSADVIIRPDYLHLENEQDFADLMSIANRTYDLILCFKAINELVQNQLLGEPYFEVTQGLLTKLSRDGLFILADVTTRNNNAGWYPQIMNNQINCLLRQSQDFSTIVPYPCFIYEDRCAGCYMQDIFFVTHRYKEKDKSKLAYRIIGRNDFVKSLHPKNNMQYQCRYNNINADKKIPYENF